MIRISAVVLVAFLVQGCATSTIVNRRQEKLAAYNALPAAQRELVDHGQIQVGMGQDAVYIAWGPPEQVLEEETQEGHTVTWLYHGQWMQESQYWNYREVSRGGTVFMERYPDREYDPRDYVRAEIIFAGGKVVRWRTLPRPTS